MENNVARIEAAFKCERCGKYHKFTSASNHYARTVDLLHNKKQSIVFLHICEDIKRIEQIVAVYPDCGWFKDIIDVFEERGNKRRQYAKS